MSSEDSANRASWARGLSPREIQVITLTACGYPVKEVAAILGLSPFTIKTHLQNIGTKLRCSGRVEMVARACRLGIVAGPAARGEVDGERF